MYEYVKDHALRNVWCSPDQDTQYIIQPARLTGRSGAISTLRVLWDNIRLPDTTSRWHVYQIGQLHPLLLGLLPKRVGWASLTEACNTQKMICDIYNVNGINLPRFETHYQHTADRNLIIAVKRNDKIPFDFNEGKVFLRVYSNEYFNSLRADMTNDFVHTEGKVIANAQDLVDIQTAVASYAGKDGIVYSFVNGVKVHQINGVTAGVGDIVEYVYDSTIYKVVDFKIGDLRVFGSTLDEKQKYLLHYAGADNQVIDYQDDIDVFILDKSTVVQKGLYYHKNNEDALRMVTHRDYSIVTPYVARYATVFQTLQQLQALDPHELWIRLHIRKSGYERSLVYEANRIHELYKMQDADILKAMLGIDSTVPNWRADKLENAAYTEIMRDACCDVTLGLVEEAYGYNAVSKLVADTPQKPYESSGRLTIDVPYGLQTGATAYEYDENGLLLGWYHHYAGSNYYTTSLDCAYVEMLVGLGGSILDEHYGFTTAVLNKKHNHRVYLCKIVAGAPDNKFVDVTDTNKYSIVDGVITWLGSAIGDYPMVRSTARFFATDFPLKMTNGELRFSLKQLQKRNSVTSTWTMQVPMGEIDVFLNKKSLIRDLDYVVRFPEVVIINKEYLDQPLVKDQDIHVRFRGFCDKDLNLTKQNDPGFIQHGVLSNNYHYDIRDDKVLHIVVDGRIHTRDELTFSEFHPGVSIINVLNGRPYVIKDTIVPLKTLVNKDTYEYRKTALATDKAVADYLSKKIPQPERNAPSAIAQRYQIFSPFINKLVHELKSNRLDVSRVTPRTLVHELLAICKPYEELLRFDPTQEEQAQDSNYVIIHPHSLFNVIELELFKYQFLQRIVKIYTHDLVNLSPFIVIKP